MLNLLYFIIVLSILIFVHEFGHFLVARMSGVKVLTFSLGFGRKLLSLKRGETEYVVSALPLGGYVKMLGESTEDVVPEEEAARSYSNKSPIVRILIAFSGPFFNILFAAAVFFVIFLTGYPVPSTTTEIGQVMPGEAAYAAGLKPGDVVLRIDGKDVAKWSDLQKIVSSSDRGAMKFEIGRGGRTIVVWITPRPHDEKNVFGETVGKTKLIGVAPTAEIKRESLAGAASKAFIDTANMTELTVVGIVKLIKGSISAKNVGGPLLIFQQAGERAKAGKSSFLFFLALISVNLGIINLLPIPILDGGHIIFSFIEIAVRRKIPVKAVEIAQKVGLGILVSVMVLATFNDVMRLLHVR
ncbi:MAG: RIP metalloprotease RseP [Syntrophorhabdales bacterium]|jgi:regulator of sigma E protease